MTSKVGRPSLYETVEDMELDIARYFQSCDDKAREYEEKPRYTISGLSYALNMTRETLRDYGTKELFSDTVRKAKQKIEISLEEHLYGTAVTGVIFNLKNNFGWKDKQELDSNVSIKELPDSIRYVVVKSEGN